MSHIYIGFSRPKGWQPVASIIREVEGTPFNHVFIRYRDPATGVWLILEASHFYVHLESVAEWDKRNEVVDSFKLYLPTFRFLRLITQGYEVLQKPYSMLGLLGHLVKKVARLPRNPYQDKGRSYICSELVASLIGMESPEEQTPLTVYRYLLNKSHRHLPLTGAPGEANDHQ